MSLPELLQEIRGCRACAGELPHAPRPVVTVTEATRILIAGQAPGRLVHESGVPWNDPSGDRLRDWLGVGRETFYGHPAFGVAAMAFCFPGTDPKGGDFPPPKRCAAAWRPQLIAKLPNVELTLLIGSYSQAWALGRGAMTERVRDWRAHLPGRLLLPHPSWRNTAWLKRNPWFDAEVVPYLRQRVQEILEQDGPA